MFGLYFIQILWFLGGKNSNKWVYYIQIKDDFNGNMGWISSIDNVPGTIPWGLSPISKREKENGRDLNEREKENGRDVIDVSISLLKVISYSQLNS